MRFELEKYGLKDQIDNKTLMINTIDTFKKYNLVDVIGKIGEVDCSIRIYPSIQFALNGEEFRQFVEKATERFKYADEDDGFEEEEIDEFDE